MHTTNPNSRLTERDHTNMDAFIESVLDDFASGHVDKATAISAIAHVIAAIDMGNIQEARTWFEQGRKKMHRINKEA